MTKKKPTKKTTSLMWDENLKMLMEERAKQNDRSLNNEIVRAIKFYLAHAKTEDIYVSEPQVKSEELEVSQITKQEKVEEEKSISIGGFGRI